MGIGGASNAFCFLGDLESKVIDGLGENGEERLEVWGQKKKYVPATPGLLSSCDKKSGGGAKWLRQLS